MSTIIKPAEKARYVAAYRALSSPEPETVHPILLDYIRDLFLLTPDLCESDNLLDLCDASLRHILELKKQGIYTGDISRSCSGASSVVSKKVLLLKTIQEDFDVGMTPGEFAAIDTVWDLAVFICNQHKETFVQPQTGASAGPCTFDPQSIRKDFPALSETIHGHPLIYLDNAATGQMPRPVAEAVRDLECARGNVHRGTHSLSRRCTDAYENARRTCAAFIQAAPEQIVFTSGTTDGINRAADAYARRSHQGVVVTRMEHHSNFLPWQQLCRAQRRPFRICPLRTDGQIDLDALDDLLRSDIGLLAITQCSNVTGTVVPVREICDLAHSQGICVLVDGAQSVCHMEIDVRELGCDYFACSGHKLGAPFGIGLLYCAEPLTPVRFGGGMVDFVQDKAAVFDDFPLSAEAGTPNVSGAVGMATAISYRQALPEGWQSYEQELLSYTMKKLSRFPDVRLLGDASSVGSVSFTVRDCSAFEIGALLDQLGFALRAGHHCAQPLLRSLGTQAALRVSPCFYNTREEIDALAEALTQVLAALKR